VNYRTAKLALLVALVALGLFPLTIKAQQREAKQEAAARQKETARKSSEKKGSDSASKERFTVTPEREAAVLTFVKRNHAELASLLEHLKESQPKEYERAIRELYRTSERLTQIHDRDREQYDLEVRLWKTQSRIQLLTARLQMGESDQLRRELKDLLGEQVDNRAALLGHERQKVLRRLAKIDADLERLADDRDKVIERQLQALTSGAKGKKLTAKNRREGKTSAKASDSEATNPGSER
jgi:hypothetical protein